MITKNQIDSMALNHNEPKEHIKPFWVIKDESNKYVFTSNIGRYNLTTDVKSAKIFDTEWLAREYLLDGIVEKIFLKDDILTIVKKYKVI